MDRATIEGCRAKVDRAEAALNELADKWAAWLDTNPYPSRVQVDDSTGQYGLFYDFSKASVPLTFSARIGEIAHGLRSALDHLIWAEAVELLGESIAEDKRGLLYFPLLSSRVAFKKSKLQPYVSKDAWTIIERHQPYSRGKPKRSRALLVLHEINRIDKHRNVHVGIASTNTIIQPRRLIEWDPAARMIQAPLVGIPTHVIKLKRETEIARFFFDPAGPNPNVRVQRTPALNVSFGDLPNKVGGAGFSETANQVRQVVDDFARIVP